jgi:thiamine biosynthesis protein ThiS
MTPIHITVNGMPQQMPSPSTLADCIAASGQAAAAVSTAVNAQFVPRERRASCVLKDGDTVFTFAPITGG